MLIFLLKGLVIGALMSFPVGPVGILCVQRTFSKGRLHGFISGVGAATADLIFAFITVIGLTYISEFLFEQQIWLKLFGGFLLLIIGGRIILTKYTGRFEAVKAGNLSKNYFSAFFLTLLNPSTILALSAVFAVSGLVNQDTDHVSAIYLAIGFFLGICFFWFCFSGIFARLTRQIKFEKFQIFNKLLGSAIAILGLTAILSLLI